MSRNIFETIMGAVVLCVAAGFIFIAYKSGNISTPSGYEVFAKFDRADGLALGSDVRVSGLKVGAVTDQEIDEETYLAIITMSIDDDVKLPKDSSAEIVSDGLLGGKYIALVPGAEEDTLDDEDEIKFTQSSISIEQLIGKFVFGSAENSGEGGSEQDDTDTFGGI